MLADERASGWLSLLPSFLPFRLSFFQGAIDAAFGSFDQMQSAFNAAAAGRFGSGWAWLGVVSTVLSLLPLLSSLSLSPTHTHTFGLRSY